MSSQQHPEATSSRDPDALRAEIDQTRANLSQNVNALGDAVTPGNIARRQASKATGAAVGLKDKVMGSAHDSAGSLGDRASGLASSASGTASDAPAQARRKTQGNPLAAGLVALGAGWLVGSLLPSSQKERDAAMAVKDQAAPLVDQGKELGKEAVQNLQQPAQEAAEAVTSRAQEAAGTVKSEGQQQAADVRESAADSQQSVQEHQARPDTSL